MTLKEAVSPFSRFALVAVLLLAGSSVGAAVPDRGASLPANLIDRAESRHYVLDAEHTLRPADLVRLQAAGCDVQKVMNGARYIVRIDRDTTLEESDPVIRSLKRFSPESKISSSASREAARLGAYVKLNILFHDDVSFEAARAVVESLGGSADDPLRTGFELPRRLRANLPATAVRALAEDESVFAVYGPAPKKAVDNANAAALSSVTALYAAPYSLSGLGVVASVFDIGGVYFEHVEFGGRVTKHTASLVADHPTHVSGTIAATGLKPLAKGMAPSATVHQFDINDDDYLQSKQTNDKALGVSVDNNSWGYTIGWDFPGDSSQWVWNENHELFGAYYYDDSVLDQVTRNTGTLMVHSAGNDADRNGPSTAPFKHYHVDAKGNSVPSVTWCYDSTNLSATNVCPATLTNMGCTKCEAIKHPANGPAGSIGITASSKNVITVGAVDSGRNLGSFSSRGPTLDGRIKPDVVAKGLGVYSTMPANSYAFKDGTSMSSPVVSGISVLLVEQWRRLFHGARPTPATLKAVLIQGAEDLGVAGPDYQYGFGLVNATASIDLIRTDNASGSRIRIGSLAQGGKVEFPFTTTGTGRVRLTLAWADPEVVLAPEEVSERSRVLINDLDLTVIDPDGNTVQAYVLDPANPGAAAMRGRNDRDNVEQVEINAAVPGQYRAVVTATSVDVASSPQEFVLASSSDLQGSVAACSDPYEPNDSIAAAYGNLSSGEVIVANACAGDVDFYNFNVTRSGVVSVTLTATTTPIRITLSGNGSSQEATIAARTTGTVSLSAGQGASQIISAVPFVIRVEAAGAAGSDPSYTMTPLFGQNALRRRSSRR